MRRRRRLEVTGVVQGVGYRPFVFRLATAIGVGGFVQNTGRGVTIEIEGDAAAVADAERRLAAEAPALARVAAVTGADLAPRGDDRFVIRASDRAPGRAWIPPDLAACDACLADLHDPANRRHGHAFVSCTDCGPRYSIAQRLPFDRAATSMAAMTPCAACAAEFTAAADRRFHAQTIACRQCGPRLAFTAEPSAPRAGAASAAPLANHDAIVEAIAVLRSGGILAVKGVGAYHLACDARHAGAVRELRRRKARPDKPLAVLAKDLAAAEALVMLSSAGREALRSPARPVVLAPAQPGHGLDAAVAGGVAALGVMLPPSPLHVCLADAWHDASGGAGALVMTSANASDAPAIVDDGAAAAALIGIADGWLRHDRAIVTRADDSVGLDAGRAAVVPIRLARGFCPVPLALPAAAGPLLAVGGEFKAAACLAFDDHAVLAPHVGDMAEVATLDAMADAVDHLCRLLGVEPEVYVCDAHPGYLSSRWADAAAGGRAERVQHHHAHAASLMAEHGLDAGEHVVTVCFDGTGFGVDGAIWGGEVLDASFTHARRLAHLAYAPLPGGDAAIRHPARAAYAYARDAAVPDLDALPCTRALSSAEQRILATQVEAAVHVTPTSSMGRLFDVVAAICGVAATGTYEGQAAMRLEAEAALAADDGDRRYDFEWGTPAAGGPLVVDWRPLVRAVAADVRRGAPTPSIAAAFHRAVADLVIGVTAAVAPTAARIGLSGGVFQNARLLRLAVTGLRALGITALTHVRVPPNDGGLSLGQAAVTAARLTAKERR